MKDLRDPTSVGTELLRQTVVQRSQMHRRIPLTEVWDSLVSRFQLPDYTDPSTIDRYGKPGDAKEQYAWIRVR